MNSANLNSANNSGKNNLEIYQKYLELIYYTNNLVRKFPKCENFTLVQEIKTSMYTGLRYLMYAIKTYKLKDKLDYLGKLDVELALLKVHIRLANRYKYISQQNYSAWSEQITNIGNMLGGWINSCAKK